MRNGTNATAQWLQRLDELIVAPVVTARGMLTRELIGTSVTIDMNQPFVRDTTRKISDKFRYAEAYWILSGDNRVESITPYAPSIEQFSDNSHVFQGAYGPKVTEQLRYVCDTLAEDPQSRQAVLSIWRENPRKSKDVPCTLSLQFLIRDGEIHCVATMRSSDVWLGLPYDMFNFSCIANWVRLELMSQPQEFLHDGCDEIKLGDLTINMVSSHIYERNMKTALSICEYSDDGWWSGQRTAMPIKVFGGTAGSFVEWLRSERDSAD